MAGAKVSKNSRVPVARPDGAVVKGYILYKGGFKKSKCTMVTINKQDVFFREQLSADVAIARAKAELGI